MGGNSCECSEKKRQRRPAVSTLPPSELLGGFGSHADESECRVRGGVILRPIGTAAVLFGRVLSGMIHVLGLVARNLHINTVNRVMSRKQTLTVETHRVHTPFRICSGLEG